MVFDSTVVFVIILQFQTPQSKIKMYKLFRFQLDLIQVNSTNPANVCSHVVLFEEIKSMFNRKPSFFSNPQHMFDLRKRGYVIFYSALYYINRHHAFLSISHVFRVCYLYLSSKEVAFRALGGWFNLTMTTAFLILSTSEYTF